MGKVTVRWLDKEAAEDKRIIGGVTYQSAPKERVLEGDNVGYKVEGSPYRFAKIWADNNTLLISQDRVISIDVEN